jgi:hypothetical protein
MMTATMYQCKRCRGEWVSHLDDFSRDEAGVLTCKTCSGPVEAWEVDFEREQWAWERERAAAAAQGMKGLKAQRQERIAGHRLRHAEAECARCQFEKEKMDRRYGVNSDEGAETRQALLTAQRELAAAQAAWQAARTGGRRDG